MCMQIQSFQSICREKCSMILSRSIPPHPPRDGALFEERYAERRSNLSYFFRIIRTTHRTRLLLRPPFYLLACLATDGYLFAYLFAYLSTSLSTQCRVICPFIDPSACLCIRYMPVFLLVLSF